MNKYISNIQRNQEKNTTYFTLVEVDDSTGQTSIIADTEILCDNKFSWKSKKKDARKLGSLYVKAIDLTNEQRWQTLADKLYTCAEGLDYWANVNDGQWHRRLHKANFCNTRLCPMCATRRAHRTAVDLSKVIRIVYNRHPGVQYLFLTLTIPNVPGDELGDALSLLINAWSKLRRQRKFERGIKGWYRAIEITRNRKTGEYHPHIHAIIAVEDDYFDKAKNLYITQAEWVQRWGKLVKVNNPVVDIRAVYNKNKQAKPKNDNEASLAAVLEAAKYSTKSSDWLKGVPSDKAVEIVMDYTRALHRKRLTAYGGWLKEVAMEIGAEDDEDGGDLIHDEDDISDETAEFDEHYGWGSMGRPYDRSRRFANIITAVGDVADNYFLESRTRHVPMDAGGSVSSDITLDQEETDKPFPDGQGST